MITGTGWSLYKTYGNWKCSVVNGLKGLFIVTTFSNKEIIQLSEASVRDSSQTYLPYLAKMEFVPVVYLINLFSHAWCHLFVVFFLSNPSSIYIKLFCEIKKKMNEVSNFLIFSHFEWNVHYYACFCSSMLNMNIFPSS